MMENGSLCIIVTEKGLLTNRIRAPACKVTCGKRKIMLVQLSGFFGEI